MMSMKKNMLAGILLPLVLALSSCSNVDKFTDLGKDIVEAESQDSLSQGIYRTISLAQPSASYSSVRDSLSGLHVYKDSLSLGGAISARYPIGTWEGDTTLLRLTQYAKDGDTPFIRNYLDTLRNDSTIIVADIRTSLIFGNVTGNNPYDHINVELGMLDPYTNDSTVMPDATKLIPLNYGLVDAQASYGEIPLLILVDSTDIIPTSYFKKTKYQNIDTVTITEKYRQKSDLTYELTSTDTTSKTGLNTLTWVGDTLSLWTDYVDTTRYDSLIIDTIVHTDSLFTEKITLFTKSENSDYLFSDTGYVTSIKASDTTKVIISIDTTYRILESVDVTAQESDTTLSDSTVTTTYYRSPTDTMFADTIIQVQYTEKTQRNYVIRSATTNNTITLDDTLSLYIRLVEGSQSSTTEPILHISSPLIKFSYRRKDDTTTIVETFPFTEMSMSVKSTDIPPLDEAVTSGALEQYAKIKLDLDPFWEEVQKGSYIGIGTADLVLTIDTDKTKFPEQYGDSILVRGVVATAELTPGGVLGLNSANSELSFYVHRDSAAHTVSLSNSMIDILFDYKLYTPSSTIPPCYLYLWIDGAQMGRIFWDKKDELAFTYILQTSVKVVK